MSKYNAAICLLIKDENRYLDEWLDWHVRAGFEHFFIYDNGSAIPPLESINEKFRQMCTIIDWSGKHRSMQIEAYTHCLNNYGKDVRWMACIDTDEFIRVIDGSNIQTFMKDYEDVAVLAIRWVTFNANGQVKRDNRPVRERFKTTVEYPLDQVQHKCIVNPLKVRDMGAHGPITYWSREKTVDENHIEVVPFKYDLPRNRIVVDHYFTRSLEEWKEKMARGSCDPSYARKFDWFWKLNPDMKKEDYDDADCFDQQPSKDYAYQQSG